MRFRANNLGLIFDIEQTLAYASGIVSSKKAFASGLCPTRHDIFAGELMKNPQKTESFGERVKRLRNECGLTQKQLAEISGVSGISSIEKRPGSVTYPTALALANALQVDVNDLYDGPEKPMPAALARLLASPAGKDITDEELPFLCQLRARGKRPTEQTYYLALQALRSMESGDSEDDEP